jgi:hypothetical protein
VHPIYFVSPEVLYDPECTAVLKEEIRRGAQIGAHLHPEYIEPDSIWGPGMEKVKPQFPCYGYEREEEKEKLANLTKLIREQLGITPLWYRAARFGADADTMEILQELGYQYDSSVTPNINWNSKGGPDHSKAGLFPYVISETAESQILEYPVTIFGKRFGIFGKLLPENWLFYRWLRPTHMTYLELKHVINQMEREQIHSGVMMFHSMEIMINKTPYVRNKWMQDYYVWRLKKTLAYLRKKGYEC